MLLPIPPLRRRRSRRLDPSAPSGPAVVHVRVARVDENRYCWYFDRPFDDAGSGGWIPDDVVGLTLDDVAPDGIDEVMGADGTLTLHYSIDGAGTYEIAEVPAVLLFDVGPAVLLPENGPVRP